MRTDLLSSTRIRPAFTFSIYGGVTFFPSEAGGPVREFCKTVSRVCAAT